MLFRKKNNSTAVHADELLAVDAFARDLTFGVLGIMKGILWDIRHDLREDQLRDMCIVAPRPSSIVMIESDRFGNETFTILDRY